MFEFTFNWAEGIQLKNCIMKSDVKPNPLNRRPVRRNITATHRM